MAGAHGQDEDDVSLPRLVVGAGPAGLMAALGAARAGARVIVFDQLPEAGVKLLATGGGRCNFTNTLAAEDFIRRFGDQSRFVAPALKALDGTRLRLFFERLGAPSHSPDGFHVFPVSGSARSIRDALVRACQKLGVELRCASRVEGLGVERGRVSGLVTARGTVPAGRVVLAAGGAGYPDLVGGEGGYALARRAGHTLAPLCPALAPLVTREDWPGKLAGITLPRVAVKLACANGSDPAEPGSLLFTHKGISGPVVLNVSGVVSAALLTSESAALALDLVPDWTKEDWNKMLERERREHGARTALSMLAAALPAALARVVLELAEVSPSARLAQLARAQGDRMIRVVMALPLTVTRTEGFGKAMVTRGGVRRDEVWPKTLESRLVRGLFFAGEILDVDGPCGGFNLHWAFASGSLAGGGLARSENIFNPAHPRLACRNGAR